MQFPQVFFPLATHQAVLLILYGVALLKKKKKAKVGHDSSKPADAPGPSSESAGKPPREPVETPTETKSVPAPSLAAVGA